MNHTDLQVCLMQQDLVWENPQANLSHFNTLMDMVPAQTDLIVLPEMFSTGFSMNPSKFAETMDGMAIKSMIEWSQKTGAAICGSLMMAEKGNYYNRFIWVEPNGKISYYDKRHLFRMGEEQKHYTAGSAQQIIHYKGWKIAPFVCYDLRFPVWIRRTESFDYDLQIFVANWPQRREKHWDSLAFARAIENQSYLIAVNRVGTDAAGVNHSGHSKVIDPLGEVQLFCGEEVALKTFRLNKEALIKYRESFPVGLDADKFELS